jgi:hypothetical protein
MLRKPSLANHHHASGLSQQAGAPSFPNEPAAPGNLSLTEPPSKRVRTEGAHSSGRVAASQTSHMAAGSRPIPATANAAAAGSGTVAAGSRASAKTLTKKKLQEFDEANQREEPTTSN